MLGKNIQIVDIDAEQVARLGELFARGRGRRGDGLIVFYEENRVLHAVHTRQGPRDLARFEGPRDLEALARAEGVDYVVALERGAARRMAAAGQSRVRWDDLLAVQALAFLGAFQKELNHTVHVYPELRWGWPRPEAWMVRWARRLLWRERLYAMIVYDETGEGVWLSAISRWKEGEIILLTTTESLQPLKLEGLRNGRKNRAVLDRIREVWGQATGVVFLDREGFRYVAAHDCPLTALRRLLRLGWAQAAPFPIRFRVLLWVARWMGW